MWRWWQCPGLLDRERALGYLGIKIHDLVVVVASPSLLILQGR